MILQGSAVTLGFHMGGTLVMELEEVAEAEAVVIKKKVRNSARCMCTFPRFMCVACVVASVLYLL